MESILHPKSLISLEEIAARLGAIEKTNQRYAQLGGSAVGYDTTGRISSLNADYILAGTIDAGVINVENLDASNITSGTLSANRIGANSITAGKLNVSTLSAISADLGTITAGSITGITITGGTLRTSSSGIRVQMRESSDSLEFTDSGGNIVGYFATNGSQVAFAGSSDLLFAADIDMWDGYIKRIAMLLFSEFSSAPSSSDGIYYYKNGGSYGFRSRMEGGNWGFDQSGV